MGVSQTREKLQTVLSSMGLDESSRDIFMYMLEPMIQDFVTGLFENTFTPEERNELVEGVTQDERLNEKDIAGILFMEYEKKTGKSMEQEIDGYINFIAKDLERITIEYKKEIEALKQMTPEERTKKMLADISSPLDVNVGSDE